MKVESLMKRAVRSCRAEDTLQTAARLMWDNDCGCVPVVDDARHVIGMITDRDICMAALHQGRPLAELVVSSAMSWRVVSVRPGDGIDVAEERMRASQIRRLPVVDEAGRIVGLVSLADIAGEASRELLVGRKEVGADAVTTTLAAVCRPRKAVQAAADTPKELALEPASRSAAPAKKGERPAHCA
jgi:CBS domain-containing protein